MKFAEYRHYNRFDPHSKVRRGGNVCVIPSEAIVTGDIVLLEAGDTVPADLRLMEVASLSIEEAALIGESVPAHKSCTALPRDPGETSLGDRTNVAYMGANVTYGRGEGAH